MRQSPARAEAGEQRHESGYVFTTRTGRQAEPRDVCHMDRLLKRRPAVSDRPR